MPQIAITCVQNNVGELVEELTTQYDFVWDKEYGIVPIDFKQNLVLIRGIVSNEALTQIRQDGKIKVYPDPTIQLLYDVDP